VENGGWRKRMKLMGQTIGARGWRRRDCEGEPKKDGKVRMDVANCQVLLRQKLREMGDRPNDRYYRRQFTAEWRDSAWKGLGVLVLLTSFHFYVQTPQ
jgi:hypothetical protein